MTPAAVWRARRRGAETSATRGSGSAGAADHRAGAREAGAARATTPTKPRRRTGGRPRARGGGGASPMRRASVWWPMPPSHGLRHEARAAAPETRRGVAVGRSAAHVRVGRQGRAPRRTTPRARRECGVGAVCRACVAGRSRRSSHSSRRRGGDARATAAHEWARPLRAAYAAQLAVAASPHTPPGRVSVPPRRRRDRVATHLGRSRPSRPSRAQSRPRRRPASAPRALFALLRNLVRRRRRFFDATAAFSGVRGPASASRRASGSRRRRARASTSARHARGYVRRRAEGARPEGRVDRAGPAARFAPPPRAIALAAVHIHLRVLRNT